MSDTPLVPLEKPRLSRKRYLRRLLWGAAGLTLLLILGIVGLYFWASSSSFENIVRRRLIARIEAATGGRAEIGSFHWNLLKLECEADGVVLHGREAAGEAPYAKVDSLRVALSVLGFWSPRVLLRDLVMERAQGSPDRKSRWIDQSAPTAHKDRDARAEYALRSAGRSCGGRPRPLRLRRAF